MKKQGSITIFAAMCLLLIASFLFALLEAGYVRGLSSVAKKTAELSMESVFAEYQSALWKEYGILALDGAYGNESFSVDCVTGAYLEALQENLKHEEKGTNLFSLEVGNVSCKEYQLLTDGQGGVFLQMMAAAMKEKVPKQALQALQEQYEKNQQTEETSEAKDGVENGLAAIAEAKEQEEQQRENGTAETEVPGAVQAAEEKKNPLEEVKKLKQMAILSLVVPDTASISDKNVDFSKSVSKRRLRTGTAERNTDSSLADKILAAEYCGTVLSNYCNPNSSRQLTYELEYVLCGKESDRENLEAVIKRLLLLREAANFCSISMDMKMRSEALAAATSLAGASANAPIIKAVQAGVMAAWAYAESVLDLRALLAGDKISFLKSSNEWTVDTTDIMQAITNGARAKHCENGFSYQDYSKQLLWMESQKKFSYRVMDLMENQIQSEGYTHLAMDGLITEMTCESAYRAENRFSLFINIGENRNDGYFFQETNHITYLP